MKRLLPTLMMIGAIACTDPLLTDDATIGVHIETITPSAIPSLGGVVVTVTGINFDSKTQVRVGGELAIGVTIEDDKHLRFVAPARPFGPNDLQIENGDGLAAERKAAFVYYAERIAFEDHTVVLPGFGVSEMLAGDIDGDGRDDLLVSNADFSVVPYLNTKDGTAFVAQPAIPQGSLSNARFVDLDGDGRLDVLGTQGANLNLGNGTFGATILLPTPAFTFEVGDVDGDGRPEVLVLGIDDLTIIDFSGSSFAVRKVVPELGQPYSPMATADFDHDGKTDVAIYDAASHCVVLRHGPEFAAADGSAACAPTATDFVKALLVRDLDKDGYLDLFAEQQSPGALLFHGTANGGLEDAVSLPSLCGFGFFARFVRPTRPSADVFGVCNTETLTGFAFSVGTFHQLFSLDVDGLLAELDGDGRLDLVIKTPTGVVARYGSKYGVTLFNAHPALVLGGTPADENYQLPVAPLPGATPRLVSAWLDVLTLSANRGEGMVALASMSLAPLGSTEKYRITDLAVGDLDGDGDADLVARIYESHVTSATAMLVPIYLEGDTMTVGTAFGAGEYGAIKLADLDGDHRADVIVTWDVAGAEPVLFRNRADGFAREVFMPTGEHVQWLDVDGDGDSDAIGATPAETVDMEPQLMLWRNDAGALTASPLLLGSLAMGAREIRGVQAQRLEDQSLLVWVLVRTGAYGDGRLLRLVFDATGARVAGSFIEVRGDSLAMGDVDGDGLGDAVVTELGTATVFAARTDNWSSRGVIDLGMQNGFGAIGFYDLDGDGLDDAYYTSPAFSGKVVVIRNQGE